MKLETFEQVVTFLNSQSPDWETVELGDSLFTVKIHIEGDRYKATIPDPLLKSLSAYQDAIYRIYAMAQYGSENIKNLTDLEKESLNVWFSVSQGSSTLEGIFAQIILALMKALKNMDSKDKKACIIALAGIFTAGIVVSIVVPNISNNLRQVELDRIAQEERHESQELQKKALDSLQESLNKHDKTIALLETAVKSTREAQEQLVKGATHASHITIGKKEYKEEDIKQIQSSKRNPSESKDSVLDNVLVTGIIRSDDEDRIYTVEIKTKTGEKYRFNAVMDTLRLDDEAYDARAHKVLFESFLNKKPISVTINVRTYRDKSTRQQLIDAFFLEDDL